MLAAQDPPGSSARVDDSIASVKAKGRAALSAPDGGRFVLDVA